MFNSGWRHFSVIVGLLILLSACSPIAIPWPPNSYLGQNAQDARYAERCDELQQDRDGDLCQQWRMAVAAENMVLVAILQTGIVTIALGFSIWAAIASSRQARASEDQLASMERAHLIVHFDDDGLKESADGTIAITGPTKWKLHNYSDTPAYIRWRHAEHSFLPDPQLPPPYDWEGHIGGSIPFGLIVPPKDDSWGESVQPLAKLTPEHIEAVGKKGTWYFQGFVAYTDNSPGMHILVFTYMFEEGEFRILSTGSFEEDAKYNSSRRRYRPKRIQLLRRRLAQRLRKLANGLDAKPRA